VCVAVVAVTAVAAAAAAAATTTNVVPRRDIDLINYRMLTPLLQNKRGRRKGAEKTSKAKMRKK
jgi:hypothetical protein